VHTYNITAGVGAFDGKLVHPYLEYLASLSPEYPFQVLPYTYYAAVYNLVANSMFSTVAEPIDCQGEWCVAYLLSGGVIMATPWIPEGNTTYPMVKLDNVPSMHLEFESTVGDDFHEEDCQAFGSDDTKIGVRFCVAPMSGRANSLRAGMQP